MAYGRDISISSQFCIETALDTPSWQLPTVSQSILTAGVNTGYIPCIGTRTIDSQ